MPESWTEAEIKEVFGKFGHITSIFWAPKQYAFICYGSQDQNNYEYGPNCAHNAVENLNEQVFDGCKLYVKPALKKSERQRELAHEALKFKNSKKRCNLFVKGFAANATEDDLRSLFASYGEIESMKLFKPEEGRKPFAFICYTSPDIASQVKNSTITF